MKIAVPVATEDGLNSLVAESFGSAPCFAVAEFDDGRIVGGGLYDSVSHDEFGCAGIAEYVTGALGADAVVVHEISSDALAWLQNNGTPVHHAPDASTAAEALRSFLQGA